MDFSKLDATLKAATDAGRVPGVVAVAADADGIMFETAHGKRALDRDDPMTIDSVFWIASMTKAITGVGAMKLVEDGRLDLDSPIGRWLPELAAPMVLEGFDADGAPRLRPAARAITLRHLMTHTSGFSYDRWNGDMLRYMQVTRTPPVGSCRNASLTTPLIADPGTRWEYGISIDRVGKAIEVVTRQRLGDFLRETLFSPLGMHDTGFKLGDAQRARLVGMHLRNGPTDFEMMPFEMNQAPEFEMGGGGLYGTAHDYIRFIRMMLGGGALDGVRVFKPETVAQMGQNQMGAINTRRMVSVQPRFSDDFDLFPEQDKKWGCSFQITTQDAATGRRAGSLSWAGLANTYFWIDPAAKVGGVVMTQLFPFGDPAVLELLAALEHGVYSVTASAAPAAG